MMTGCAKKTSEPDASATQVQPVVVEDATEDTTENDIPDTVKITMSDVRTYCVSIDAARNTILNKYDDKIPEKLRPTFDANSEVLDGYLDKAAGELTDDETEQLFNNLKNLETFFCQTMADELKLGDELEQVAIAATKGADYYFEKASEEDSEESSEEDTEETSDEVSEKDEDEKDDKKSDSSSKKKTDDKDSTRSDKKDAE